MKRKYRKMLSLALCLFLWQSGIGICPVSAEDSVIDQAKAALASAKTKLNEAQAQVNKGSVGFFEANGDSTAVSIINTGISDGRAISLSTGLTQIGSTNDATSLDKMEESFSWLKKCNSLRTSEGRKELLVSDRMMALAQIDANYSSETLAHWSTELSRYGAGENLCYGYSDPFAFWYTLEKNNKLSGYGQTAHYENIINASYVVTGFGINTKTSRKIFTETFGSSWCMNALSGGYGTTYTVSAYEAKFSAYCKEVRENLKNAQAEYTRAETYLNQLTSAGFAFVQDTFTVNAGDTVIPEIVLADSSQTVSLSWSVSDEEIAQIDASGTVTGRKAGTVTVTAKSDAGKSVSCKVKVLFTDVPESGVYYSGAVYWAVEKGITAGFTDEDGIARCFGPERACTRAQMVTFLWRLARWPEPKSTVSRFSDVTDSSLYYYKAVLWAEEKGITKGYEDGTFRPDDTCLREHAVTFLWRYAGKPNAGTSNTFTDVSTNDYYYMPVVWAAKNNIAKGYADDNYKTFRPKDDCLREHIVTFLYRYAK